ncbi:MAG: PPM-type phosphatase protein [Ignavibacteria bacterium]|nr:PPM-type phosphatase protein [Ignavibacteria bacterium]
MRSDQINNQRNIYKIVEKLSSRKFKNELTLLKTLIHDIVSHKEFEITGGRIWELNPIELSYTLKYQFGKLKKIPDGYSVNISDHGDTFTQLLKERTLLNYETDELLKSMGIWLYSMTGVGEIVRTKSGKFYKYVIGFNADSIKPQFSELLSVISSVASVHIQKLSNEAKQNKFKKDIKKASEIQRNLLPEHHYKFCDYSIFGICVPDSGVGGDYFDYLKYPGEEEDRLGVVIMDAASKGLSAAIQALFVSGAIRMAMGFSPKISLLLNRLNSLIFDNFPYERFVTLVFLELTTMSNRLVLYANAGHCQPIHYTPETDRIKFLSNTGGLLGLMKDQKFTVENFRLHPGDVLVLYTDGITEANDGEGNFFGEDRLCEIIRNNHHLSPQNIAYSILEDVQKFSADSFYNDDKTLVVIKREHSSEQDKETE